MRCKTERHQIRHGQTEYDKLSQIGECAKNLRNVIVWYTRQHFFNKSGKDYTEDVFSDVKYKYLNYYTLYKYVKEQNIPEFRMLPANVAQDIIRRVVREWTVYKKLLKMKAEGTYTEKVGIPRYTKKNSVYNTIYMRATLSDKSLKENIVDIPKTDISVKTLHADTLRQVNVSYRTGIWFIDVVYEDRTEIPEKTPSAVALGIDCGIDNFATIVANDAAFRPVIFDGRELKSINRYYNKLISQYKS